MLVDDEEEDEHVFNKVTQPTPELSNPRIISNFDDKDPERMTTLNKDEAISPLATFGNNFMDKNRVLEVAAETNNNSVYGEAPLSMNQSMSMISQGTRSNGTHNMKNSKLNKRRFPKDFFQQNQA